MTEFDNFRNFFGNNMILHVTIYANMIYKTHTHIHVRCMHAHTDSARSMQRGVCARVARRAMLYRSLQPVKAHYHQGPGLHPSVPHLP